MGQPVAHAKKIIIIIYTGYYKGEKLHYKCRDRGEWGGYSTMREVGNLFWEYGAQLWISGHNHNAELMIGTHNGIGPMRDPFFELKTGAQAKDDGLTCGGQDDIDEQYGIHFFLFFFSF